MTRFSPYRGLASRLVQTWCRRDSVIFELRHRTMDCNRREALHRRLHELQQQATDIERRLA